MKKSIYELPFTARQIKVIENEINNTFTNYLKNNQHERVTKKELERLKSKAKDQLTVYIKSLSSANDKWSMSHKTIPILVKSKDGRNQVDLMSMMDPKEEDTLFYFNKIEWFDYPNGEATDGMTYNNFKKRVYQDIYEGASTAAFYAIESFCSVRREFAYA